MELEDEGQFHFEMFGSIREQKLLGFIELVDRWQCVEEGAS